jgi:hypothetical protein
METTFEKAERLTYYLKAHRRESDALIDPVLDKLIDQERRALLRQRDELRAELDQFEELYGLRSDQFAQKFEQGNMGDDFDFFDWAATWNMYQTILESLESHNPE